MSQIELTEDQIIELFLKEDNLADFTHLLTRTDEPIEKLHKILYKALLGNVLEIRFTKKSNKRYRKLIATLSPKIIPDEQKGKGLVDRSKKYEYLNVYDLKKKDWRTFLLDKVDMIKLVRPVDGDYLTKRQAQMKE